MMVEEVLLTSPLLYFVNEHYCERLSILNGRNQSLTELFSDGKQCDISDLCSVIPDLAP